jgi:hypothetical protein
MRLCRIKFKTDGLWYGALREARQSVYTQGGNLRLVCRELHTYVVDWPKPTTKEPTQ